MKQLWIDSSQMVNRTKQVKGTVQDSKVAHLPQQQPLLEISYTTLLSDTSTPSSYQISL